MKKQLKLLYLLVLLSINTKIIIEFLMEEETLLHKAISIGFLVLYLYVVSVLLYKVTICFAIIPKGSVIVHLQAWGSSLGIILLFIFCVLYIVAIVTDDFLSLWVTCSLSMRFAFSGIYQVVYDLEGIKYYFSDKSNMVREIKSYTKNEKILVLHFKEDEEEIISIGKKTKKNKHKIDKLFP